jgi:hypothetical protein
MKTVFEPSNALEGHMLQDLLQQRGIAARLEGAALQGAIGELPATGLVRLVVGDEDFGAARAVIDEWENASVSDSTQSPSGRRLGALAGGLVGLILGIGGAFIYFRAPVADEGVDHNDDGALDERWKMSPSGSPVKTEIDRDFDGAIDFVWSFDRRGQAISAESDDDFNGSFESRHAFRRGQIYLTETDTDGDSIPDVTARFSFGVLATVERSIGDSSKPIRVETYLLGRLVSADVDTNHDGTLDRRFTYDAAGEVLEAEDIDSAT